VTETLLAPILGAGTSHGDLGTLNVIATDTVNTSQPAATDKITVGVIDDAPVFQSADHGVVVNVADTDLTGNLSYLTGADAPVTLAFAGISTSASNPTSTSTSWNGHSLSEYVDSNGVLHGVANGSDVFTVSLNVSNSTYSFDLLQPVSGSSSVTLPFSFTITDSDGSKATGGFDVTTTGTQAQVNYSTSDSLISALDGTYHQISDTSGQLGNSSFTSATNVLVGGPENDIFISQFGPDTMTGGGGSDIFKLENVNVSDVITDFIAGSSGTHDTIDLTQLLNNSANLANYVEYNATTGALSVDPTGTGKQADFHQVATIDTNNNVNSHPAAGTILIAYQDQSHHVHSHTV
jgi:hypothetical protein